MRCMGMGEKINFRPACLSNVDWNNDDLFFTYSWNDIASPGDPKARWNFGAEEYERTYKARVPLAFQNCEELCDQFVNLICDNYFETERFWVD